MKKQGVAQIDIQEIARRGQKIVAELSERFPSRNGLNPSVLHGAAAYVEKQLKRVGYAVESRTYEAHGVPVRNLAVVKQGKEGLAQIVLGAHYDSVMGTPGADDNATGVAGLIELARLLKDVPTRRTVRFVAFPHEEPPFFYTDHMGSRHYAKQMKEEKADILVMFALEMLGYAGERIHQQYPFMFLRQIAGYPRYGNFIGLVGNLRTRKMVRRVKKIMRRNGSIGVESLTAPGFLPPLFLSDHSSFWRQGYPAIMVTDTAFLRNPHYHLASDTVETLNFEFYAQVVKAMYETVKELDHGEAG